MNLETLKNVMLTPIRMTHGAYNHPTVSSSTLHRTGCSSLDILEYAPGQFEWCADTEQSACVLSGTAHVELSDGRSVELQPGSSLYLPSGMMTRWTVEQTLRTVTVRTRSPRRSAPA